MHIVEEQEFCDLAYPAFTKVFNVGIDKHYYFSEVIPDRAIVHDTSSDNINDAVPIKTIVNAGREVGDKGCYFYLPYPNLRQPDYYYVEFNDLEEIYCFSCGDRSDKGARKQTNIKVTNLGLKCHYSIFDGTTSSTLIYSESGQWGIRTSLCSSWGIVGGTSIFISNIKENFPIIERQIFSFLFSFYVACESDGTNFQEQIAGEIKSDLVHVYGMSEADKLIDMNPKELLKKSGGNIYDFIHPDFISKYASLI